MNWILNVAMLLVGASLAGWLALVAYDLGNNFSRFSRLVERGKRSDASSERRSSQAA